MFIKIEENLQCSNCEAKNRWEKFSRSGCSGIRCLRCGHEKIDQPPTVTRTHTEIAWVKAGPAVTRF